MISGTRPRLAVALLVMATTIASAADQTDTSALIDRLARPGPETTAFVEVRFSSLLKEPLVVAGELEYRTDGGLVRRVLEPYRETTTLLGENVTVEREGNRPRRFSLDRAPELRGILSSFGAMLKGDRATLERQFEIVTAESGTTWRIELVPRSEKLRARLARLRVDGFADHPNCMTVEEPDGDSTVMALGARDRAALPAALVRDRLQSWCSRDGAR
jgi:hypothetical protein